jgi:hypothetical protein
MVLPGRPVPPALLDLLVWTATDTIQKQTRLYLLTPFQN